MPTHPADIGAPLCRVIVKVCLLPVSQAATAGLSQQMHCVKVCLIDWQWLLRFCSWFPVHGVTAACRAGSSCMSFLL